MCIRDSSNTWQNNWLNYIPGDHVGLPSYHYSRFGGAIGGPLIPKDVLGGKTFFFFNYEGFRYPNSETIDRNVPSPALQLGLLTDSKTGAVDYNLNNAPVIYNGTPYPANYGCTGLCDPLGMGLNPLVSQIWSKYEPGANAGCSQSLCDGANICLLYTSPTAVRPSLRNLRVAALVRAACSLRSLRTPALPTVGR